MPRTERKHSNTGIYHVLIRGINKQLLFEEQEDYSRFLACLEEVKQHSNFALYAYCLMGNHIHLLLKEGKEPLAQIFKRLGARYVFWFNWKYGRSGHLFQDRFRSEAIETDDYFITVLCYIYQNPVKAGLCKKTSDYEWSSRKLLGEKNELIDESELFGIANLELIKEWEQKEIDKELLEPTIGRRQAISDIAAFAIMKELSGVESITEFQALDRGLQRQIFDKLRREGVSIRQFARLSGLSKGVCERMC